MGLFLFSIIFGLMIWWVAILPWYPYDLKGNRREFKNDDLDEL